MPRTGALYTPTTSIAAIGEMNGDGGLSDLLVESDIVAVFLDLWGVRRPGLLKMLYFVVQTNTTKDWPIRFASVRAFNSLWRMCA